LLVAFTVSPNVHAQMLVNIETVRVGDPGNAADTRVMIDTTSGYGAVGYEFNIGKYEVTINQYATFLNSVASVVNEPYLSGLWTEFYQGDAATMGSINRSGSGTSADPYKYSVDGSGNHPMRYVGWGSAMRFANWLHNGATDSASTETGAYALNGGSPCSSTIRRDAGATWWLPTENEWYKAAYYKGGGTNAGYWLYPTQSDTAPGNTIGGAPNQVNYMRGALTDVGALSNSPSAYGTYDQGGNVYERMDAPLGCSQQAFRGGGYSSGARDISSAWRDQDGFVVQIVGFRIATVPEPSTYALLAMTAAGALWWARRRR